MYTAKNITFILSLKISISLQSKTENNTATIYIIGMGDMGLKNISW